MYLQCGRVGSGLVVNNVVHSKLGRHKLALGWAAARSNDSAVEHLLGNLRHKSSDGWMQKRLMRNEIIVKDYKKEIKCTIASLNAAIINDRKRIEQHCLHQPPAAPDTNMVCFSFGCSTSKRPPYAVLPVSRY